MVDNGALGSGFGALLCDNSSTTKNISNIFQQPRDINGTYDFTYHILDSGCVYFPNGFVPGTGSDTARQLLGCQMEE